MRGLVAELAERGLKVDYRSVWNFVHARSSASKKTVVASERDRPDVARRRAQWIGRQNQIDPERLVFIDETWTKTNMEPLRGWASRGQRLVAKVPHGHWKTTTFIAALRHDRIEAPWMLDGPVNAAEPRQFSRASPARLWEVGSTYIHPAIIPRLPIRTGEPDRTLRSCEALGRRPGESFGGAFGLPPSLCPPPVISLFERIISLFRPINSLFSAKKIAVIYTCI